jgi:hypothetical protein
MWLYDMPTFELCYVMVSTHPELLSQYDPIDIHEVDHIDPAKRITSITFERDAEIEIRMQEQLLAASLFYEQVLTQLQNK